MPDNDLNKEWTSGKIVLAYILVGCLWILLSDRVLMWFYGETDKLSYYQTFKGCFFVLATAGMLYGLINRGMRALKDSESARAEVKQRYRELVENASDLIYTLDLKGHFTSVNGGGEKITGYRREDLLKLNLKDIVAPAYQQIIRKFFNPVTEEKPAIYEAELIKKDGSKVLLEISSRQISQNGNITGFQGIARDITARRIVEESLKQSEARYRDLIATANEGIIIVDNNGAITFVNQKVCEMLDHDSEELLDGNILDFIGINDISEVRKRVEHQMTGFRDRFDFKFRKLDETDLWVSISASPIFKDGEFVGSLGMITDINERKIAEESLLREKYINDSMVDSLPGIFYLYDKTGKFLRWNQNFERVSGYSSIEMEKMHPLDFFEGEEKILLEQKINEVFEKGEESVKAHFISKDGTRTPYFFTGKRILLGDMECLVGMGIDISDRLYTK